VTPLFISISQGAVTALPLASLLLFFFTFASVSVPFSQVRKDSS
jgi:hypothetical protein